MFVFVRLFVWWLNQSITMSLINSLDYCNELNEHFKSVLIALKYPSKICQCVKLGRIEHLNIDWFIDNSIIQFSQRAVW